MNRGNLAEDPRVDRPSSSRYSRYGSQSNALLYVSDREWKEALSKEKSSSHAAGKRGTDTKARKQEYRSVSAKTGDGRQSYLEVGKHGRLFGVHTNPSAENGIKTTGAGSAPLQQDEKIRSAAEVFRSAKPSRPYLDAPNPLLARQKQNKRGISSGEERRRKDRPARGQVLLQSPAAPVNTRTSARPARCQAPAAPLSAKKMLIAAGAGVFAAGYIAAGMHFSDHFYPGTEFFGIEASGDTVSQVKQLVEDKVSDYSLTIEGRSSSGTTRGITETVTAGEVGLHYRDNGLIDKEMDHQYPALWPVMMLKSLVTENNATLGTEYDQAKVETELEGLSVFDKSRVTAPRDAALKYNSDGAYVSKEVMGTTLDQDKTRQAIIRALNDGSTILDLEKEGLYQNPTVFQDDSALNAKAEAQNKVLGANIFFDMGDRSITMDPEMIAGTFLSVDMDGNYRIDADKVTGYVAKLAEKTDTAGKERTFRTSLGTTVSLTGGDYGWTMDAETTADDLGQELRDRKKGDFEPTYYTAAMCRDEDDIGDSYVEIDLTNQHMWFYKNGSIVVDTPVVTGNPQKNNQTPSGGVWSLKGKYRNATLKGQGYATPVDYWMPFNGGVGIHDLQSRYYFGGAVYNGAGSHGCINTPLAAVKLIYHSIETGTPVIVYEDESEKAVSQNTGMQDIGTITGYIESTYGTVSANETPAEAESGGQTFHTNAAGTDGDGTDTGAEVQR